LARDLCAKGFTQSTVEFVLDHLRTEGYQSDERLTARYFAARVDKGFGPLRIRAELQARGVSTDAIDAYLRTADPDWRATVQRLIAQRYGEDGPVGQSEQGRCFRLLEQRGFPRALIRSCLLDR
jgi:regulatory protein